MGKIREYVKEFTTLMRQTQACWLYKFGAMGIAALQSQNNRLGEYSCQILDRVQEKCRNGGKNFQTRSRKFWRKSTRLKGG